MSESVSCSSTAQKIGTKKKEFPSSEAPKKMIVI
jgi:hypothetical protein